MIDRRRLFALLSGAALAPLIPEVAPAVGPIVRSTTTFYPNYMVISPEEYCRMANEALRFEGDAFRADMERRVAEAYRAL